MNKDEIKNGIAGAVDDLQRDRADCLRMTKALRDIHEIATRHNRASDLKTYLLSDLESIERLSAPNVQGVTKGQNVKS